LATNSASHFFLNFLYPQFHLTVLFFALHGTFLYPHFHTKVLLTITCQFFFVLICNQKNDFKDWNILSRFVSFFNTSCKPRKKEFLREWVKNDRGQLKVAKNWIKKKNWWKRNKTLKVQFHFAFADSITCRCKSLKTQINL
jgi:hypothetical protein